MLGYQWHEKLPSFVQLQLKNQSYEPMAPNPDYSCCVGFINLSMEIQRIQVSSYLGSHMIHLRGSFTDNEREYWQF